MTSWKQPLTQMLSGSQRLQHKLEICILSAMLVNTTDTASCHLCLKHHAEIGRIPLSAGMWSLESCFLKPNSKNYRESHVVLNLMLCRLSCRLGISTLPHYLSLYPALAPLIASAPASTLPAAPSSPIALGPERHGKQTCLIRKGRWWSGFSAALTVLVPSHQPGVYAIAVLSLPSHQVVIARSCELSAVRSIVSAVASCTWELSSDAEAASAVPCVQLSLCGLMKGYQPKTSCQQWHPASGRYLLQLTPQLQLQRQAVKCHQHIRPAPRTLLLKLALLHKPQIWQFKAQPKSSNEPCFCALFCISGF